MLVIRETANHWLGGVLTEGFDRYYYKDGLFKPWSPSALHTTSHIDEYLYFLISTIDITPSESYLPVEDEWLSKGIPAHHILLIVDQLMQSGLLIENDVAGDIEHYSLESKYEWPKRWNKFSKSRTAFTEKIKFKKLVIAKDEDEIENQEYEFDEPKPTSSAFIAEIQARRAIAKSQRAIRLNKLKILAKKSAK
jgi:hypothetical protein